MLLCVCEVLVEGFWFITQYITIIRFGSFTFYVSINTVLLLSTMYVAKCYILKTSGGCLFAVVYLEMGVHACFYNCRYDVRHTDNCVTSAILTPPHQLVFRLMSKLVGCGFVITMPE